MRNTIRFIIFIFVGAVLETAMAATLRARVEVGQSGTNFSYTIFNDEPLGSSRYLNIWHLEVNAPFQVISTPPGWDYVTDYSSCVDWFSTDSEEPYPRDIAPGASLAGFVVGAVVATSESLGFAVMSWEHGTTNSGPSSVSAVTSPSVLSLVATLVDLTYSPDNFKFTVAGVPSLQYTVEVSSNLTDWTAVTTNAAPFTFQDTPNNSTVRFFRAAYVDSFGRFSDAPE